MAQLSWLYQQPHLSTSDFTLGERKLQMILGLLWGFSYTAPPSKTQALEAQHRITADRSNQAKQLGHFSEVV